MGYATCTAKSVFHAIVRMGGLDPLTADLSAAQKAAICELVNERIEEAWKDAYWPEIMLIEQRQYRETWDEELNYSTDDEVYFEDDDGEGNYYISLQNVNVGHQPDEADSEWWEVVGDDFLRTINFRQDGESVIDAINVEDCVYDRDPRIYPDTEPLRNVVLYEDNVLVRTDTAPLRPWIKFRPLPPEFSWTDWTAATNYAIGDLCYLDTYGETYKSLQPSSNKNPYSETGYWRPVGFPSFLRTYVKHAVRADRLSEEEGRYKEEAKAEKELELLQDRLIDAQQPSLRKVVFRAV